MSSGTEGTKAPFLVRAIQDFTSTDITFKKNQIITVLNSNEEEYLYFGNYKGKTGSINGWFPSFFVQRIDVSNLSGSVESKPEKKKEEEESEDAKKDAILNRRAQRKQRVAKLQQQSLNSAVVASKREKLNLPGTSRFRSNSKGIEGLALDSASPQKSKEKLLEDNYVLKSGMMWKRSEKGGWKQRWVVIRTTHICYYHSAVDKKAMGQISIKAIKNITIERGLIGDTDFKNLKFCFAINTGRKKGALILGEKSIEELLEWIKMLDFAKAGGKPENAAEIFSKENESSGPHKHGGSSDRKRLNLLQGLSFSESLLDLARLTSDLDTDFLNVNPHGFGNYLDSETLSALLQPRGNKSPRDESCDLDTSDSMQLSDTSTKDFDDDESNPNHETTDGKTLKDCEATVPAIKYVTKKVEVVKTVQKVRALYDYAGTDERQLAFRLNDTWTLLEKKEEFGWWYGEFNGKFGLFPSNYVTAFEENVIEYQEVQVPVEEEKEVDIANENEKTENNNDEKEKNNDENNEQTKEIVVENGEEKKEEEKKEDKENKDENEKEKEKEKEDGNRKLKSSFNSSPSLSPNLSRKASKSKTMLENFQLGEPLGKGAFGSVYRGINVDTGEMVAIKQVSLAKVNEHEVASIMAELELLKELDHVNIVQYKGFIKTSDHINLVLDYVEGGSLSSILGKFGPMHGVLVIRYIKQILEGLDYLHSKGVVHRDIKCANILITKNGTVKLSDFGISSKLTENNGHEASGSPYWMAPEIIQLKAATTLSDIWSLGATIVELLTGKPPYFELNKMQAMFSIVEDPIPPLPEDMTPEIEDFLRKCFQKDLQNRPTAKELLEHSLLKLDAENHAIAERNTAQSNDEKVPVIVIDNHKEDNSEEPSDKSNTSVDSEEDLSSQTSTPSREDAINSEELSSKLKAHSTEELISNFSVAMNEKNIELTMSIRKNARETLKRLRTEEKEGKIQSNVVKSLMDEIIRLMIRCEDEMGEHIPIDSDVEIDDSDSEFEDELDEEEM